MNPKSSYVKVAISLASAMLAGWLLAACSQSGAPGPNIIQRAEGETSAAPPPPSGFLGSDYSLLQAPSASGVSGQQAMLAYISPSGNFASYNKIIVAPVTYWADPNSTLPANE